MMKKGERQHQLSPVPVKGGHVHLCYVRNRQDLKTMRSTVLTWARSTGRHAPPEQSDAIAFARAAMQRWSNQHTDNRTADSVQRIRELKKFNPNMEIGILGAAIASWLKRDSLVGIFHFRCTWSGNIALDYLVSSPLLMDPAEDSINGLGTGILHHVCCVAEIIGAKAVWGETTPNSVDFYKKVVSSQSVADLIVLKQKEYLTFKKQLSDLWKKRR